MAGQQAKPHGLNGLCLTTLGVRDVSQTAQSPSLQCAPTNCAAEARVCVCASSTCTKVSRRARLGRGVHCQARRTGPEGASLARYPNPFAGALGKPDEPCEPIPLPQKTCPSDSPPLRPARTEGAKPSGPVVHREFTTKPDGPSGQAKGGGSVGVVRTGNAAGAEGPTAGPAVQGEGHTA
jgi:hypothetical protein